MKILLTGASGLLGTDIAYRLSYAKYEIIKTTLKPRKQFISVDLNSTQKIKSLAKYEWDTIIHTAATRDPDICETSMSWSYVLNVLATKDLAMLAAERKAKFLFISTDYVFPGTNPPYSEESPVFPVNFYGRTKVNAEEQLLSICENACILRLPLLYGIRAQINASPLLYSSLTAIKSKKETFIDNVIIRYPTCTEDVAKAILFLLQNNATGIYHYSGEDKLTKYQVVQIIAECLNKKIPHVHPLEVPANTPAKRPLDSHLDTRKIFSLGLKKPHTFKYRIEKFANRLCLTI